MSIKKEELVPIAEMILASFERDLVEFEAENYLYNQSFLTEFKTQIESVRKLEEAEVLLTDQKTATIAVHALADELKQPLRLFKIVIEKAGIPTSIVQETINSLNKYDMEAVLSDLKTLIQIVDKNKDLLISKGMKTSIPDMLESKYKEITIKSNLQKKIMQNRQLLTSNNTGSHEALQKTYISDICKMGKTIYQNNAKSKEYTIIELLKKVHTISKSNKDDKNQKN